MWCEQTGSLLVNGQCDESAQSGSGPRTSSSFFPSCASPSSPEPERTYDPGNKPRQDRHTWWTCCFGRASHPPRCARHIGMPLRLATRPRCRHALPSVHHAALTWYRRRASNRCPHYLRDIEKDLGHGLHRASCLSRLGPQVRLLTATRGWLLTLLSTIGQRQHQHRRPCISAGINARFVRACISVAWVRCTK